MHTPIPPPRSATEPELSTTEMIASLCIWGVFLIFLLLKAKLVKFKCLKTFGARLDKTLAKIVVHYIHQKVGWKLPYKWQYKFTSDRRTWY